MAVREFNGTSDELVTGVGACSGMTYGTVAVLIQYSTVTSWRAFCHLHNSSSSYLATPLGISSFTAYETVAGGIDFCDFPTSPTTGRWYVAVCRKGTGTVSPRLSTYDFNTTTWTHRGSSGGTVSNWTSPGASGQVRFSYQGTDDRFGGRIAARALWSNSLPWASDSSGDSAIAAAGLQTSAANWLSNSPSAFWLFNQASTGTAVDDVSTTGTADQTSITGTTVVTTDDPPGFDFSLSSGATATPAVIALTVSLPQVVSAGEPVPAPSMYVVRSNLRFR